MRRPFIIVALALALVPAFGVAPAFAKYAGYSSTKQYVPWAEAQSMASLNADAALMASGPHAGYATTTIKCAVCHSLHRGGSTLLNEGSACVFCHSPASEGGGAIASNLISWYTPAQGPHDSCGPEFCHGGPHGIGASQYAGPATRLLTAAADVELDKLVAANEFDGSFTADLTTYNPETRAMATGAVCARDGCHSASVMGIVDAGARETGLDGTVLVTGHRVVAAATSHPDHWIAYAPVDSCSSCHDLADDNNGGKAAFPHALSGVVDAAVGADGTWRPAIWLTAGPYTGAARFAVGEYDVGGSLLDGVCLKCHRASSTTGVGYDY